MNDKEIKLRIFNFYKDCKFALHSGWSAAGQAIMGPKEAVYSDLDNYHLLDTLGANHLTHGTNNNKDYPEGERLAIHNEFQSKQFKDLTGLGLDTLFFPKVCGFNGDSYGDFIIPPTAYRLGYYMSHIKNFCDNNKKRNQRSLIVEIGGGWGGLCNLVLNNVPNANYVIVDTPTSLCAIAYFLHKCGKRVCLPNEFEEFNKNLFSDHDCVLITPDQLRLINDCDYMASAACLPELPPATIDYYIGEIKRILPEYLYVDFTHAHNGRHLMGKLDELSATRYEAILQQITPISCYVPWVVAQHWEIQAKHVEERIYVIT